MASYLVKDGNYFTVLGILIFSTSVLISPHLLLQQTPMVSDPNSSSSTIVNSHVLNNHDSSFHPENEPLDYEPYMVTIMPLPQTIIKDGSIMSMSVGSSHISYLKTFHGIPLDVPPATSVVPITRPEVNLDTKSYMWQDKIFLEITDPFNVKDSSKIETIGNNQNKIIVTIGSMATLDCTLSETGKGTGFFTGIFLMKSPWVITSNHDPYNPKCTVVHQNPEFVPGDEHVNVSFEYAPNEFVTASSPIIMGSFSSINYY